MHQPGWRATRCWNNQQCQLIETMTVSSKLTGQKSGWSLFLLLHLLTDSENWVAGWIVLVQLSSLLEPTLTIVEQSSDVQLKWSPWRQNEVCIGLLRNCFLLGFATFSWSHTLSPLSSQPDITNLVCLLMCLHILCCAHMRAVFRKSFPQIKLEDSKLCTIST